MAKVVIITKEQLDAAFAKSPACNPDHVAAIKTSPSSDGHGGLVYDDFDAQVPRLAKLFRGAVLLWFVRAKLVPMTKDEAKSAIRVARHVGPIRQRKPTSAHIV